MAVHFFSGARFNSAVCTVTTGNALTSAPAAVGFVALASSFRGHHLDPQHVTGPFVLRLNEHVADLERGIERAAEQLRIQLMPFFSSISNRPACPSSAPTRSREPGPCRRCHT